MHRKFKEEKKRVMIKRKKNINKFTHELLKYLPKMAVLTWTHTRHDSHRHTHTNAHTEKEEKM